MADLDTTKPFTFGQAKRAGLSRRTIQGRGFREVVRGIYVAAETTDVRARAWTGLLVAGVAGAFVSHHEAARWWGGVVPHDPRIHVSVPVGTSRRHREGVLVHLSRRTPRRFKGLPVTTPTDTFLDLAGELGLVDLVVLGDSLVRRSRTTPEELITAADAATGKHVRLARRAARLVRHDVDSPMETRCRLLMVLAGLPEPEVNILFWRPDGSIARRLDLGYSGIKLGIEYDGQQHKKVQGIYEEDILRHEEFDDREWRIITLLSKDIYVSPGATLDRLVRVLRARGMKVPALRQEWRRYFPIRERAA